ncbi:MAG TPA: hypothetical protein VNF47_24595 [Streptosporangiaceae bacterium]|nr:hypothetical protein [Streptosporangiaceae bacterium]
MPQSAPTRDVLGITLGLTSAGPAEPVGDAAGVGAVPHATAVSDRNAAAEPV